MKNEHSMLGEAQGALELSVSVGDVCSRISTDSPKCVIGSGPDSTIRIDTADVHPVHCVILRGQRRTIVRKWSGNAHLNGSPFLDALISPGDVISIGNARIQVVTDGQKPKIVENSKASIVSEGMSVTRSDSATLLQQRLQSENEDLRRQVEELESTVQRQALDFQKDQEDFARRVAEATATYEATAQSSAQEERLHLLATFDHEKERLMAECQNLQAEHRQREAQLVREKEELTQRIRKLEENCQQFPQPAAPFETTHDLASTQQADLSRHLQELNGQLPENHFDEPPRQEESCHFEELGNRPIASPTPHSQKEELTEFNSKRREQISEQELTPTETLQDDFENHDGPVNPNHDDAVALEDAHHLDEMGDSRQTMCLPHDAIADSFSNSTSSDETSDLTTDTIRLDECLLQTRNLEVPAEPTDGPSRLDDKIDTMAVQTDATDEIERETINTGSGPRILEPLAVMPPEPSQDTSTESKHDEDDDFDMGEYMKRLLSRVESDTTDEDESGGKQAPAVTFHSRSATKAIKAIKVPENDNLDSAKVVRRVVPPELSFDLTALRQIANQSARQAISVSTRARARNEFFSKLIMALVVTSCGIMLWIWSDRMLALSTFTGCLAIGIATVWVVNAVLTSRRIVAEEFTAVSE